MFITHLSGCTFTNLTVTATAATGIGIDFLYDGTVIRDCRVVGCGRLNGGTLPGGAGIGIGTGARDVESFLVTGNHCAGNARFGIFVESQTTRASTGGRIVANTCVGNRHGIGDCGMAGTIVLGNTCVANVGSGIVVNTGTLSPLVSRDGQVVANVSSDNGEHGILFDVTRGATGSEYVVRGNRCDGNGKAGIKLVSNATRAIAGVAVVDNDVHANGSLGVHVATAGAHATDLTLTGNRCAGNGQTNTAGFTQGIRVDASTDRFTITGNACWDNGSPPRQTYGVQLSAGATFVDGHVAGNHVTGNAVGGLNLAGTLVGCRVTDNSGPELAVVGPLAPGPSPWTYTAGPAPEVLYLSGGSVRAVVKGGAQLAAATPVTVVLRPNEQV
ncbi:MAG TPA: right-handed parallel beta-helix repeat-containing protein, partial [Ilumatobacteraceae bacterium]|nr:right-handed parallel beta-helix repeat-containing protein [Ilumatobacteraceae bacterium]